MNGGRPERDPDAFDLAQYRWTYPVTIGELHPNVIATREEADRRLAEETELLNRCLKNGRILAKTQTAGVFAVGENGEHQLLTGSVTFIVGFKRKPYWLPEKPETDHDTPPSLTAVPGQG